ncbi:hypothetical protein LINPERPRIM_LOCUS25205, partial [Linum perenne]
GSSAVARAASCRRCQICRRRSRSSNAAAALPPMMLRHQLCSATDAAQSSPMSWRPCRARRRFPCPSFRSDAAAEHAVAAAVICFRRRRSISSPGRRSPPTEDRRHGYLYKEQGEEE